VPEFLDSLTVADRAGGGFGANQLSTRCKDNWEKILSKPKISHQLYLLLCSRPSFLSI